MVPLLARFQCWDVIIGGSVGPKGQRAYIFKCDEVLVAMLQCVTGSMRVNDDAQKSYSKASQYFANYQYLADSQ